MVDKATGKDGTVHIVYTQRPEGEEPEAHDIRTLSSVLGRYCYILSLLLLLF